MQTAVPTAQNFIRAEHQKARPKFQVFRAVLPTVFIENLQRLAQCSDSETLKRFFLFWFIFLDEINYEENPANCVSENMIFSDMEFLNLLKDLTAKEKTVIILKYKYGFSTSEIAKKNKVSVQAVYKLEKHALNKLRKLLP